MQPVAHNLLAGRSLFFWHTLPSMTCQWYTCKEI
jgi:hypothetical protein